jgi:PAS domain S-box-containing protein
VEADFVAKDGTCTSYLFTGRRVEFEGAPCLIGVGIDISERKHAQDRLNESERQYRELVKHANSIILHWSRDGHVIFLNEFGQRFFGYTDDEIRGLHVVGTIVPESDTGGRDLKPLMDEICANPVAFEQNINENMRRNGERVWIAWTNKVALDAHGQVTEILSIGTDITAQKRAEDELRTTQASLEQRVLDRTAALAKAMHAAEAADRIKSAFLATMSHELRTPLNSIIGFTGLVLQGLAGPLNPEQSKQLGMVRTSAHHLLELINDVLDISRIEAGQLEIRSRSFELRESIDRVIGLVGPLAEKKGLALELVMDTPLGEMVSDRRRVEQILINLLNNAIKFTERGTVTLSATCVNAATSGASTMAVRLRVADTGIGIRSGDLDRLFQPFHQVDSGLTRQHEGTGLGLAICRRLSGLLSGEIAATSQWGKGSEFTVTLPLNRTSDA